VLYQEQSIVRRLLSDLFGAPGNEPGPVSMTAVEAQLRQLLDELAHGTRGHARVY
jgi:hypothetical protein